MPCRPDLEALRDADPVAFRKKRDAATAGELEPFAVVPESDNAAYVVWVGENKVLGFTSVSEVLCTKLVLSEWGWHPQSVIENDEWLDSAQAEHSDNHLYDTGRLLYVIRGGVITYATDDGTV